LIVLLFAIADFDITLLYSVMPPNTPTFWYFRLSLLSAIHIRRKEAATCRLAIASRALSSLSHATHFIADNVADITVLALISMSESYIYDALSFGFLMIFAWGLSFLILTLDLRYDIYFITFWWAVAYYALKYYRTYASSPLAASRHFLAVAICSIAGEIMSDRGCVLIDLTDELRLLYAFAVLTA